MMKRWVPQEEPLSCQRDHSWHHDSLGRKGKMTLLELVSPCSTRGGFLKQPTLLLTAQSSILGCQLEGASVARDAEPPRCSAVPVQLSAWAALQRWF